MYRSSTLLRLNNSGLYSNDILISYQCCTSYFVRLFHTAICEAGFGEEIIVLVLIREQIAAGEERLQDGEIDLLRCPLALGKKCSVLVLLTHDVDFCLTFANGIIAPPAAERGELDRRLAAEQQLPEVLPADFSNTLGCL